MLLVRETCNWKRTRTPYNLFLKGYRKELISVGACEEHNQAFSKLDERLRYHMTLLGDDEIARQHFESNTVKGLLRPEGLGLAIDLESNKFADKYGQSWSRDSSLNFNQYFEKIIRGLFFYHYGKHVKGTTSYFSNKIQLINMSANAHFYYHLIDEEYAKYWIQGNPKNKDIFDYKYFYSEKDGRFFTIMKFYREHEVIVVTIPEGILIDDYGLEFEEYQKRIEKRKH